MIKNNFYTPILAVSFILIFAACASKVKRDEAKGLRKAYYNVTAKYNGYFNADVLIDESITKLEGMHRDNYNKILDIYPYVDVQNYSSAAPDLDKAIEKLAVVATVRRASDWTDDSYLQIGKAQYLKHQYQAAEEAFLYLTEMYNPANSKKAKALRKQEAAEAKKEAAEERRKENAKRQQDRRDAQEQAKKEAQKQREADLKAREEEKKLLEKQREAEKKAREAEKKDASKAKKQQTEAKKDDLESRNEARRKAAEERAKLNREKQEKRERELRERNEARRAGKKVEKTTADPSDVAQKDEKETEDEPQTEPKKEEKTPTPTPKNEKTDVVKTGVNGTPVVKTDKQVKEDKDKQKPDFYFFTRRPAYQTGLVWLARTYIERKLYGDALSILTRLERDGKTFKDVRAMVAVAKADLFLRQEAYEQAIPAVENAIKLSRKRKERSRLIYILAQLYQRTGDNNKAYANFDRVLNYTLPYEMEFNARINRVFTNTNISQDEAAKILLSMSKDRKNKELNDQIYFTLGQVALKNKQKDKAISYFEQSLQIASQNTVQRAETYYLLAKMYNEEENFVKAKNYFDSTASVLPKNDPRESEVRRYADNLADIARAINTITLQDSLLKIAAMSEKERRELAKRIKKQQEAEAEKARIANAVANANARFDKNAALGVGFEGGSAEPSAAVSLFFAYDAEKVKRGKREFEKKWGDRKLEDNWRRSNRRDVGADARATAATNTPLSIDDLSDNEVANLLKGVPTSPEEVEKSKKLVEEALFKLGTLYHDKINLDKKAVEILDKLLTRFPNTKKEVDAWYYLYLSHAALGNKPQADKYYNLILEKYGNTNYADALKNIGKPKTNEETVDKYYEKTYSLFQSKNYKNALERTSQTEKLFGVNNAFQPKFALLAAMCIGNLQGKADYINALKNLIGKHPNTPEEVRAKEMLRILDANAANNNPTNTDTEGGAKSPFVVEDTKPHYIFVVLQPSFPVDDAQVIISDFNTKYHRLEDLKVMNISLGENAEVPVAMIRSFKNKDAAMAFVANTQLNPKEFLPNGTYEIFVVTQRNYAEILRQRKIDAYRAFYQQNYQR